MQEYPTVRSRKAHPNDRFPERGGMARTRERRPTRLSRPPPEAKMNARHYLAKFYAQTNKWRKEASATTPITNSRVRFIFDSSLLGQLALGRQHCQSERQSLGARRLRVWDF